MPTPTSGDADEFQWGALILFQALPIPSQPLLHQKYLKNCETLFFCQTTINTFLNNHIHITFYPFLNYSVQQYLVGFLFYKQSAVLSLTHVRGLLKLESVC